MVGLRKAGPWPHVQQVAGVPGYVDSHLCQVAVVGRVKGLGREGAHPWGKCDVGKGEMCGPRRHGNPARQAFHTRSLAQPGRHADPSSPNEPQPHLIRVAVHFLRTVATHEPPAEAQAHLCCSSKGKVEGQRVTGG